MPLDDEIYIGCNSVQMPMAMVEENVQSHELKLQSMGLIGIKGGLITIAINIIQLVFHRFQIVPDMIGLKILGVPSAITGVKEISCHHQDVIWFKKGF